VGKVWENDREKIGGKDRKLHRWWKRNVEKTYGI